jgi:hypothetical protein
MGNEMIHVTNTDNPIDFPSVEEKNPIEEKSSESEGEFKDSLTRLKEARAAKKEKKKVVKVMSEKFGDVKLAKKMVKTAVKNINTRRAAGRGR